jgi:uncharacterized protein
MHEQLAAVGRTHFEPKRAIARRAKKELNRLKRRVRSRARNSVFLWCCGTLASLSGTPMSAAHESRNFFLPGPVGRLEAILWSPSAGWPPLAALVCHPHPLFGGTMHNKVVYQAAKSLDGLGLSVLRFNFRGTGMSEGKHDRGEGERDDVRAALDFLAAEFRNTPLLVAGFSFGCWVGLRAGCADLRVTSLVGLGAPVNNADFSYLTQCRKPKLLVHGANDIYGAVDKVESLIASLPGENELVVVEDADHFFAGKLDQVDRAITAWVTEGHRELFPARPPRHG